MTRPNDQSNGTEPVVEIVGRVAAVRPTGEIDITTAPFLRRALAEALALLGASRVDRIVTDCSRVTFCDSSGLNALIAARLEAVQANASIHLANPAPQLQRLLRMTGAEPLFPREDDPPACGRPSAGG
ncbi:STAS domain-containing protein [Streptomyces erythrochromogenes]|uniref:STAS domain-containing protein n=1 Tax=Streptomyces erythrochromogenes TaxID=285574 RepID=UPI00386561EB|nr:STAS domain-containing protein [Streptomyces erythrochromogenes]